MSNFEEIACKGLGIILFLLVIILSVQLMGCTLSPKEEFYNTPTSFPLLDTRDILHKYRDNFDKIIFPRNNQLLTRYCGAHFQWESIKAVWKCEEDGNYKWYYTISKSKKQ
jgi:hypothetical protein